MTVYYGELEGRTAPNGLAKYTKGPPTAVDDPLM